MKTISEIQTLLNQDKIKLSSDSISTVDNILINNTPGKDEYNTTVRKIDYRDIEYTKLKKINSTINTIYYIGVVTLFILLYSEDNLLLKERFLFYILLLLIPYLYPWIYALIKKIWSIMFPDTLSYGPKNAFLNNIDNKLPDYRNLPYDI